MLDRDGVINRNLPAGIRSLAEFEFLPGALEGLAMLARAGAIIAVVTNQANLGRNLLPRDELDAIHAHMLAAIAAAGGRVDALYLCPHAPEDGCDCRKPQPGMLLQAARELGFALPDAWMVGDHPRDVEAARRAGCRAVLVDDGSNSEVAPAGVARAHDLAEAARLILSPPSPALQPA
jgi:D-glycero-D-manno-heptose 1,7-bisphosphate phosphatase